MPRSAAAAILFLGSGCARERDQPAGGDSPLPGLAASAELDPQRLDTVVERFNRGVALMEQFCAAEAAEAFDEVVRLAPSWPRGRLNLGIALLNVGSDEAVARAEQELGRVLEIAPRDPHAHFTLGMLYRYKGRLPEARAAFERVLASDPEDPEAHYQLGVLLAAGEPESARLHLEKTLEKVPHHESACYQLQALLRRSGDVEGARALLERFESLKASGAGVASGMKYGEMGRYAEVLRRFGDAPPAPASADGMPAYTEVAVRLGLVHAARGPACWPQAAFEPGTAAAAAPAAVLGPGVAAADVDGDDDLDLYLPGLEVAGPQNAGALYRNDMGRFTRVERSGIDGRGAVAGWFGDYDADGDPDLYLTGDGADRLYRNDGRGQFADATAETGTAGAGGLSLGAAWADADHDGDLDLYVCRAGPAASVRPSGAAPEAERRAGAGNALFRNNGDGSFTDVAREAGIDGGGARSAAVAFLDVDDDQDLDLCLLRLDAPNQLFLNERVGRYREASVPDLAAAHPAWGAVVSDLDQDGREDLLVLRGSEPPALLSRSLQRGLVADAGFAERVRAVGGAVGALVGDLDLDADPDIVLLDAGMGGSTAHAVLLNRGGGRFAPPARLGAVQPAPRARGALAADLDADGMLELVVARVDAPPEIWKAAAPPGRHWLQVLPVGRGPAETRPRHDPVLGLRIELQSGRTLQAASVLASAGYLGSPPARAHFGLGAAAAADYVRLTWPDAVLQSEIEVAADAAWRVPKVQRKPSSCPLLFSWDGERFAFVTDFLGVGGVGFFVAPGVYAPPDPSEAVRIPPERIQPRAGRYLLRIAEPLEEVTYLDALHLVAYDHPAGVEIHPDERFAGTPPFPTGRPYACGAKIFPRAARDHRGRDVLERLLNIDRRYVEPPPDPRFVGYAEEHGLELDFGDRLARTAPGARSDQRARLVLCLHGWVEYTYSHVNYAAHQAGLALRPPGIEVPDGRGGWRLAVPDAGFPAGLPRTMTLDLSGLPGGPPGRFRLRTNMEIYWDQIFVAEVAGAPALRSHALRPDAAELRFLGFPRPYSPDGGEPTLYDYQRIDLGVPFKNLLGHFTRYGDVRALLARVDDRFVVMGRGEEIALEFDARRLPELPRGWARTLVLHADGYCKDMDLYTAYPQTVEPLPFHAMGNYPPAGPPGPAQARAAWERRWNTRRVAAAGAEVAGR